MTPAQIQSIADNLFARGTAAMANGEREYARGLLDAKRDIERLLPEPVKAPEPPAEAATAPEPPPAPPELKKKVLGVF